MHISPGGADRALPGLNTSRPPAEPTDSFQAAMGTAASGPGERNGPVSETGGGAGGAGNIPPRRTGGTPTPPDEPGAARSNQREPVRALPVYTSADIFATRTMQEPQITRLMTQLSNEQLAALPLHVLAHFSGTLAQALPPQTAQAPLARLETAIIASAARLTSDTPDRAVAMAEMVTRTAKPFLASLPQATRDDLYSSLRTARNGDVSGTPLKKIESAAEALLQTGATPRFYPVPTDRDRTDMRACTNDQLAGVVDRLTDAQLPTMDRGALNTLWQRCETSHPAQAERLAQASLQQSSVHATVTSASQNILAQPKGCLRVCSFFANPNDWAGSRQTTVSDGRVPSIPRAALDKQGRLSAAVNVAVQKSELMAEPYLVANEALQVMAGEARVCTRQPGETGWTRVPYLSVVNVKAGTEVEIGEPGQACHSRLRLP